MHMLDTNICIYAIKKNPQRVVEHLRQRMPGEVCVSSVTVAELEYGVAKSARPEQNAEALRLFFAPLEVVSFDAAAAAQYGRLRTHLEGRGTPIGAMDLLVAAHALAMPATLVTNNESEFRRVPGLEVENWSRAPRTR